MTQTTPLQTEPWLNWTVTPLVFRLLTVKTQSGLYVYDTERVIQVSWKTTEAARDCCFNAPKTTKKPYKQLMLNARSAYSKWWEAKNKALTTPTPNRCHLQTVSGNIITGGLCLNNWTKLWIQMGIQLPQILFIFLSSLTVFSSLQRHYTKSALALLKINYETK